MTRPRTCGGCRIRPVAYLGRKYCYDCVPRTWKRPPICKRCGSGTDYFTAGLCRRCHRSGPWVDSCLDCLAWGVTRHNKWLCEACRGWRRRYQTGGCPACRRQVVVNDRGYCRLCCRIATLDRQHHRVVDVNGANRNGQQLFFAEMILKKRKPFGRPAALPVTLHDRWPSGYPLAHRQLVLFQWPQDLTKVVGEPPLPELAVALERAVADYGVRHGWRSSLLVSTSRGIRILLAAQDTPGAPIRASEAARLQEVSNCTVKPVVEVLDSVGMLDDDRPAALETWFDALTAGIAGQMLSEYRQWFYALRDGSKTPPRSHPRSVETVRHRIAATAPTLTAWTDAGHQSLREITRQDIIDALPELANRRRQLLDSLRSMFRFLKGRRLVFVNPTARMRSERVQPNHPLPMNTQVLRDAINSTEPVRAALAALVAFHALRSGQLRSLKLTDMRDGRLFLADRTVVLAEPVLERINRWLAERARRWPTTANPHLFINQYTAVRIGQVSGYWISDTNRVPAQRMREDRILHESLASGGDVRRLTDLFGLTVGGAERYVFPDDPTPAP